MRGHQTADTAEVTANFAIDHAGIGKELEVRNQRQFIQAGPEGFSINPVFERGEQIPHAGNIVGKQPFLLGEDAQKITDMADQRCREPVKQRVDQVLVDAGESQLLEGGHAKGILGAGTERGRYEDQQRLAQLAVRVRVPQFHQLGRSHPERHAFLVMAAEDKDVSVGAGSPQFLANRLHDIVIKIGDPHAVARATITQDRFDTRAQQTSDRRVQFILGKLGERVTHACLPFLSVPSFLSMA